MYSLLKNKLRRTLIKGYSSEYKLSHINFWLGRHSQRNDSEEYDLVFVIFEESRGWILEAICKEIAAHFPGKHCFHYSPFYLPCAKAYFFPHYCYFLPCLKMNPSIWGSKSLVLYTHPRDYGASNEEVVYALNKASKVMFMCSQFQELLISQGLKPHKATLVLGAADPDFFRPHQRRNGAVGFCMSYYARKSPDLILNIVEMMPHRKFVLLGRNWDQYEKFAELFALPNFSYVEAPYTNYPRHYAVMDVFVSPAKLEGGPIPLIEAMMCNIVPVASRTGFAPDIIEHGENGFLFDADSPAEVICDLIEQAYQVEADVRKTVEHLSWENLSHTIQKLISYSDAEKFHDERR